jgi:hypothetical protein
MRCVRRVVAIVLLPGALWATPLEEAQQLAVDAVARETGASPGAIEIVSAQPTTWPDTNLGCRRSTSAAPQESVHGYRVVLRDPSKFHVVHVAGAKAAICATGLTAASAPQEISTMQSDAEPADPASRDLIARARDDLSRRLSLSPDDIRLVHFEAVVWPDNSYGCPRPGMSYTQVQRDGVLIRFEANGRRFNYHGGDGREPFLCQRPDTPP